MISKTFYSKIRRLYLKRNHSDFTGLCAFCFVKTLCGYSGHNCWSALRVWSSEGSSPNRNPGPHRPLLPWDPPPPQPGSLHRCVHPLPAGNGSRLRVRLETSSSRSCAVICNLSDTEVLLILALLQVFVHVSRCLSGTCRPSAGSTRPRRCGEPAAPSAWR